MGMFDTMGRSAGGERGKKSRPTWMRWSCGGYIFQSDHSVASDVSGQTYDTIVKLVREYGVYPLDLGPFEEGV